MQPRFSVGDVVSCRLPLDGRNLECKIVRVMPEEKDIRHYRIRHAMESFDRVVPEDTLESRGGAFGNQKHKTF